MLKFLRMIHDAVRNQSCCVNRKKGQSTVLDLTTSDMLALDCDNHHTLKITGKITAYCIRGQGLSEPLSWHVCVIPHRAERISCLQDQHHHWPQLPNLKSHQPPASGYILNMNCRNKTSLWAARKLKITWDKSFSQTTE